jgi:hypothetical protein
VLAASLFFLAPADDSPAPPPVPPMPMWVTNPDGTRMQCTPGGYSCWPDTSGLPSYLEG